MLETYCFKNRVKTNDVWKYKLSVESDIVHTACRIIFDKKEVPRHYEDNLKKLVKKQDLTIKKLSKKKKLKR